ncbi:FG-GAP-like repeat-containing protein [Pedobacter sp. UC225_61]|uniref:FG-GAP-like repeat-containing protein n=1 Tax=Pedobacter sp. UC225_61 TaxID=3374623 RepID=UPI003799636A
MKKYLVNYLPGIILCILLLCVNFKANAQAPTITNLNPLSGAVGTDVTITGNNFSADPTKNVVYFGPVKAAVTNTSTTSLTVTVPVGANHQYLTVTNLETGEIGTAKLPFAVTFPEVGNTDFKLLNTSQIGIQSYSISAGDLNGDGYSDMIVSEGGNANAQLAVLLNNGTGNFSANKVLLPIGATSGLSYTTVSDFNGDGKLDIALLTKNKVLIWLNKTVTQNTLLFDNFIKIDVVADDVSAIKATDVDNDGKPDIIFIGGEESTVHILRNISTQSALAFQVNADLQILPAGTLSAPISMVYGDFDEDGLVDIAVALSYKNQIAIMHNNSTPANINFAQAVLVDVLNVYNLRAADINKDGKLDLVASNGNGFLRVFKNQNSVVGTPSFEEDIVANQKLANQQINVTDFQIDDVNGDGLLDIVTTNNTHTNFLINTTLNNQIDFAPIQPVNGSTGLTFALGDVTGDGKADIVGAEPGFSSLYVFKNVVGPP